MKKIGKKTKHTFRYRAPSIHTRGEETFTQDRVPDLNNFRDDNMYTLKDRVFKRPEKSNQKSSTNDRSKTIPIRSTETFTENRVPDPNNISNDNMEKPNDRIFKGPAKSNKLVLTDERRKQLGIPSKPKPKEPVPIVSPPSWTQFPAENLVTGRLSVRQSHKWLI